MSSTTQLRLYSTASIQARENHPSPSRTRLYFLHTSNRIHIPLRTILHNTQEPTTSTNIRCLLAKSYEVLAEFLSKNLIDLHLNVLALDLHRSGTIGGRDRDWVVRNDGLEKARRHEIRWLGVSIGSVVDYSEGSPVLCLCVCLCLTGSCHHTDEED